MKKMVDYDKFNYHCIIKLGIGLFSILLFSSCFQGRPINYPFKQVSKVLKDRFVRDKQDFDYIAPEIEEEPGYLYMYLQHKIDFYLVINTAITLKTDNKSGSQIMVKIKSLNRKWSYNLPEKEMEKEFYNILLARLRSGKWTMMPWDKKYKKHKTTHDTKNEL